MNQHQIQNPVTEYLQRRHATLIYEQRASINSNNNDDEIILLMNSRRETLDFNYLYAKRPTLVAYRKLLVAITFPSISHYKT